MAARIYHNSIVFKGNENTDIFALISDWQKRSMFADSYWSLLAPSIVLTVGFLGWRKAERDDDYDVVCGCKFVVLLSSITLIANSLELIKN